MDEITVNGVVLPFDADDADIMELTEAALGIMRQKEIELSKLKEDSKIPASAAIRGYCMMYREFFDNIFGKGTSDRIFDGMKMKTSAHEEAYLDFLDAVIMQKAAIADKKQKRWQKYSVRKSIQKS